MDVLWHHLVAMKAEDDLRLLKLLHPEDVNKKQNELMQLINSVRPFDPKDDGLGQDTPEQIMEKLAVMKTWAQGGG